MLQQLLISQRFDGIDKLAVEWEELGYSSLQNKEKDSFNGYFDKK
jgi:hypothetical protein